MNKITMNKIFLFCLVAIGINEAASADIPHKCMKLFHPRTALCCKSRLIGPKSIGDLKECFGPLEVKGNALQDTQSHRASILSCERDICVAQKRGILADDGTIDEEALKKLYEKDFTESPEILKKVTENCSSKDSYGKYGSEEMCDLIKLRHCFMYQLATECPDWFTNDSCSGIKELVEECKLP